MSTTARLMSPADPAPCRKRDASRISKVGASAAPRPKMPKITRQIVSTILRPNLSARNPIVGARTIPASDPDATRIPDRSVGASRSARMLRIPVSVIAKISCSGGLRDIGPGYGPVSSTEFPLDSQRALHTLFGGQTGSRLMRRWTIALTALVMLVAGIPAQAADHQRAMWVWAGPSIEVLQFS